MSVADFLESLGFPLTAVPAFHESLRRGERAMEARTRALANRRGASAPRPRANETLGEHVARIPLDSYYYWEKREKGCWEDDTFKKEFLRDNPGCRVSSTGTRIQLGWRDSLEHA